MRLPYGDLKNKSIYWSGVTDPYATSPAITKELWQTLINTSPTLKPKRIVVQTRFRPDRDAGLLEEYINTTVTSDGGPPVVISFSIGTDRNDLIAAWEKSTPSFDQRLKSVRKLRESGVFVVATLSPFGLWQDLTGTLELFKALGVAYITCLFFKENTAFTNTPPLFLKYLRHNYPVLLDPIWQSERIQEMQSVYGKQHVLLGQKGFESLVSPHKIMNL